MSSPDNFMTLNGAAKYIKYPVGIVLDLLKTGELKPTSYTDKDGKQFNGVDRESVQMIARKFRDWEMRRYEKRQQERADQKAEAARERETAGSV